jgi:hypothetical protein
MKALNLQEIADHLREESGQNNNTISLANVLAPDQITSINTALLVQGEKLIICSVPPEAIPNSPHDTLTITVGTTTVLNSVGVPIKLFFCDSDNGVQLTVQVDMPPSWKFQNSFPDLIQFPFDRLTTSKARFIYCTAPQNGYAPWEGDDDQKISGETITTKTGLNFAGWLSLTPFGTINDLLKGILPFDAIKFFGPFAPITTSVYPQGSISGVISTGEFAIGYPPLKLELSAPEFFVESTQSEDFFPEIYCGLRATTSLNLNVCIYVTTTRGVIVFDAEPVEGHPFTADEIVKLPGVSNLQDYIPTGLTDLFSNVSLQYFSLISFVSPAGQSIGSIELAISTAQPWKIIDPILLEDLSLQIDLTDPLGSDSTEAVALSATAKILPIFDGVFSFSVTMEKQTQWQIAFINGQYIGEVKLVDIVKALGGNVSYIPAVFKDVMFSDFGISVDKATNSCVCFGNCGFGFPMLGTELSATLSVNIAYTGTDWEVVLNGLIGIGEQNFLFKLDFSKQQESKNLTLTAGWQAQNDSYLQFEDIASVFGFSIPKDRIPSQLNLALKAATLYYDFSNDVVVLNTASDNYGDAVFVATNTDNVRTYLFAIKVVTENIDLAGLPLIGPDLVNVVGNVGLDNIQLLISNATLEKGQVKKLNATISTLSEGKAPTLPETPGGIVPGAYVTLTLRLGNSNTYELLINPSANATPDKLSALESSDGGSNVSWINLQRSIGPVYISKAGVAYEDGKLYLMVDAALLLSALKIGFAELGVGNPLDSFAPSFTLGGLSVNFQSGPVTISGGFLRHDTKGITQYMGSASIVVNSINISAMGAYATDNGHPSLFIFGLLTNPPLGGPPAFFVTGVAAGFGYNRALKLPTIDDVARFPLTSGFAPNGVSPFSGNDPNDALKVLVEKNVVPVQIGKYWLAAGVKFTSFQLLSSFALLSVQFGTKLEIGLLGMSTLTIPPENPDVLAQAQLALIARILPDEGLIAVDGKLTQASYVLSPACKLVGGFAFYMWNSPNENAGDFVVTLGGYHPKFVPPPHYPQVPRLGFNWVVTTEVSIKGDMYFAVTPSFLMAGGSLQATFQSGNLMAWFIIGADFIIAWKPFHYTASMYVNFGVSYTFSVNLLFTTIRKTISVSLGADLTVWGPDFSGVAHIHLWIISFTVSFGKTPNVLPPPIDWNDFKKSFLPPVQSKQLLQRQLLALNDNNEPTDTYCSSSIKRGLIEDVYNKDGAAQEIHWIVSRSQTTILTTSLIPSKTWSFKFRDQDGDVPVNLINIVNQGDLDDREQDFGIGMVKVDSGNFDSGHNITIEFTTGALNRKVTFNAKAILGNIPTSLWQNTNANLKNDAKIENVLLGFEITPIPPKPDVTLSIEMKNFAYSESNFRHALVATHPGEITSPDQPEDAMDILKSTIASDDVNDRRSKILTILRDKRKILTDTPVSVQKLKDEAQDFLLAAPVIQYQYWRKVG